MATTKEVFPSDAILWLEFGGQYVNGAGKTVIDNLATMGNAVKTVMCGDGTTSTTFPTQLVGKRGCSFDGGDYIDTGIIDPFERTDKFSIFVVYYRSTIDATTLIGTCDLDQDFKGIIIQEFDGNSPVSFQAAESYSSSHVTLVKTPITNRLINSYAVVNNNALRNSAISIYINTVIQTKTVFSDTLTSGSIKNGKPFILGARHYGTVKQLFFIGNIYFAAIFPLALSQLQVSNLHKKVIKRINLP